MNDKPKEPVYVVMIGCGVVTDYNSDLTNIELQNAIDGGLNNSIWFDKKTAENIASIYDGKALKVGKPKVVIGNEN